MQAVSNHVFYLPHSTGTDRPALGYVHGAHAALMVDAGNSPAHVRQFLGDLHRQKLPLPDYTVLTHRHWDHCFGLSALNTLAIAGEKTAQALQRASEIVWSRETLAAYLEADEIREFSEQHILLEYPQLSDIHIRVPEVRFSGRLEIDLGGCRCQLLEIPSPHSNDSVAVYIPEDRVLFLGDAGCEACAHGTWTDQPELLEAMLHTLEALDFTVCITGHDLPHTRERLFTWFHTRLQAAGR